jgi:hypothetical protein
VESSRKQLVSEFLPALSTGGGSALRSVGAWAVFLPSSRRAPSALTTEGTSNIFGVSRPVLDGSRPVRAIRTSCSISARVAQPSPYHSRGLVAGLMMMPVILGEDPS